MGDSTMSCGHPKSALRPTVSGGSLTCDLCVSNYHAIAAEARRDFTPIPLKNNSPMSDAEGIGFLFIMAVVFIGLGFILALLLR